jgi:hypothetical protein
LTKSPGLPRLNSGACGRCLGQHPAAQCAGPKAKRADFPKAPIAHSKRAVRIDRAFRWGEQEDIARERTTPGSSKIRNVGMSRMNRHCDSKWAGPRATRHRLPRSVSVRHIKRSLSRHSSDCWLLQSGALLDTVAHQEADARAESRESIILPIIFRLTPLRTWRNSDTANTPTVSVSYASMPKLNMRDTRL